MRRVAPAARCCGIVQRIRGGTLLNCLVVAVALAGCGNDGDLPAACREGEQALSTALAAAPRPVRTDGTAISSCMTDAADTAELQQFGRAVNATAARLADAAAKRPDSPQALQLGYLAGAVRRGSHNSQGLHYELRRRLEQETGRVDRSSAAYRRGERAGLSSG